MFALKDLQKATLKFASSLTAIEREPGTHPGIKLRFKLSMSNDVLALLDPALKPFLYQKVGDAPPPPQGRLEGVEAGISDMPQLTHVGANVKRLRWYGEHTGMTLDVQYGTGRKESNVVLEDCTIKWIELVLKPGGTTDVHFPVTSLNVPPLVQGKFQDMKDSEVDIRVLAPQVVRDLVDKAEGKGDVTDVTPKGEPAAGQQQENPFPVTGDAPKSQAVVSIKGGRKLAATPQEALENSAALP